MYTVGKITEGNQKFVEKPDAEEILRYDINL